MPNSIFPPEILNFTINQQVARHSTKSQSIYITILILLLVALAALPFLYVDITVQSAGIIRPSQPLSQINSPVAGQISHLFYNENEQVNKGDTLLIIESDHLKEKAQTEEQRIKQIQQYVLDLKKLKDGLDISAFNKIKSIKSPLYLQQYNEFKQNIFELNAAYLKTKRDLARS